MSVRFRRLRAGALIAALVGVGMNSRTVTYVIKTSKLCNLRCKYCYEFAELAKRDRMSLAQLRTLFENVAGYYADRDGRDGLHTNVIFVWHGGEPLLVEPDYYWQAFAVQEEVLHGKVSYVNSVQTNLTVLDDERIRLLRDGFHQVSVSMDLYGGLRVNTQGRDLQDRILSNMDRLRDAGTVRCARPRSASPPTACPARTSAAATACTSETTWTTSTNGTPMGYRCAGWTGH